MKAHETLENVQRAIREMPVLSGDSEKVTIRMADYRALMRVADGEDPRYWVSVPCGMAYGTNPDGTPHKIGHSPHHWTDRVSHLAAVDHWCNGEVD